MAGALPTALPDFLRQEALAGVLLAVAAALAIILANSPMDDAYQAALHLPVTLTAGPIGLHKTLTHWINDGLMAVFFLLVGLEIKREAMAGELASLRTAALPLLAALGGMAIPAALYVAVNAGNPAALAGWAIPTTTDIAFAIGILAIAGPRVPPQLRAFLLALAIIDDLGAIVIIAVFYTAQLSSVALALAAVCLAVLTAFNLLGVRRLDPYVLVGVVLWACVLESGVHATLAGVALALAIPLQGGSASPASRLEHALHPYVTWVILPLFAFVNAGLDLRGVGLGRLLSGEALGIALGLLLGKPIGVFGAAWLAVRTRLATLPRGVDWRQMAGAAVLCGIGFTMSLFMSSLAFNDPAREATTRLGILAGSLLSAVIGFALLRRSAGTSAAAGV